MNPLAVQMQGVCKRYPHFALEQVDLTLQTGSILGFIGANGAGKSTTLRILLGLLHQDAGTVEVLGHAMPQAQAAAKLHLGYVSEDLRLYQGATLDWHMQFIRSIYPDWDPQYAQELLQRFDLKPQQRVKGLSHGQRVKAALLLVLARRPKLLVLDEPTTGLDPVARQEVLQALMEVLADESRSVLFSSQNTLDVEQISDSISFIDRGRIIDAGDKEDYLQRWRRVRLEVPSGVVLPKMPGVVASAGSERLTVLTIDHFDPAMTGAWTDAGAQVRSVDPMTLEEIFVSNVAHRKLRSAA